MSYSRIHDEFSPAADGLVNFLGYKPSLLKCLAQEMQLSADILAVPVIVLVSKIQIQGKLFEFIQVKLFAGQGMEV